MADNSIMEELIRLVERMGVVWYVVSPHLPRDEETGEMTAFRLPDAGVNTYVLPPEWEERFRQLVWGAGMRPKLVDDAEWRRRTEIHLREMISVAPSSSSPSRLFDGDGAA